MSRNEIVREALARYMFQQQDTWRYLCSPDDADWDEWVDDNREQWREQADEVLSFLQDEAGQARPAHRTPAAEESA